MSSLVYFEHEIEYSIGKKVRRKDENYALIILKVLKKIPKEAIKVETIVMNHRHVSKEKSKFKSIFDNSSFNNYVTSYL